MKKFLLILVSLNVLANTVSLEDGSKYTGCDFNENSREFICAKNNKTIYIKATEFEQPYAIELDENTKKIKVLNVDRLTTKEDQHYFYADFRNESLIPTQNPFFDGVMVDVGLSDQFVLGSKDSLLDDSQFKNRLSKILDVAQENLDNLENIIKKEQLVIEVDGRDVDCQKDKNSSCKVLTCIDKEMKDTFYVYPRFGMDSSFLAIPSASNKSSKYHPEVSRVKTKAGVSLISRKKDQNYDLYKATVPSVYRNNPDLFYGENALSFSAKSKDVISCTSLPPNLFKNMQAKVQKDRADAKMVSLIKFINGAFEGILVNPESLPEVVCSYNGSYYRPEDYQKIQSSLHSYPTAINLEMAKYLFDKARAREDIAWNYTYDGCYARAHLMADMFEEDGVIVEKAWARGSLEIPGGQGTWSYHVAPAVDVLGSNGETVKMIIDPSIAQGPVTTKEWLKIMGVETEDVLSTSYPAPVNSVDYGKVGVTYSSASAYWPSYDEMGSEEKMRSARATMYEYLNY